MSDVNSHWLCAYFKCSLWESTALCQVLHFSLAKVNHHSHAHHCSQWTQSYLVWILLSVYMIVLPLIHTYKEKTVSCICQFQLIVTHQLKSLTLKVSIHTLSPSNLKSGRGESRLSRGFQISFSTSKFPLPLERIKWLWKLVSATENKTFSATEMSEFGVNIWNFWQNYLKFWVIRLKFWANSKLPSFHRVVKDQPHMYLPTSH